MDLIDGGAIAGGLASSTTGYLSEFAPIFLLIAGLVLAMGIMEWLAGLIENRRDIDDTRGGDRL